jgi:outer membrane lipoprotein carrier protein
MTNFTTLLNMKITSLSILFLAFTVGLSAQDDEATAILDKLSAKMQQYESVSASFSSKMIDKQADMEVNQSGSVKVSGDSYYLQIGDYTILCDGENVWTYSKKSNEVMIDLAEDIYDDEGIAPADLLTIWETGFKNQYDGTEMINGLACDVINLFPIKPQEKSFHTIKIYIDAEALEMKRAIIQGKEGNDTIYDLNSFDTGFIKSSEFKFQEAKYPGVEVIDNR